jgi:hypothetical protein
MVYYIKRQGKIGEQKMKNGKQKIEKRKMVILI